jgi:hypothetical protein
MDVSYVTCVAKWVNKHNPNDFNTDNTYAKLSQK